MERGIKEGGNESDARDERKSRRKRLQQNTGDKRLKLNVPKST